MTRFIRSRDVAMSPKSGYIQLIIVFICFSDVLMREVDPPPKDGVNEGQKRQLRSGKPPFPEEFVTRFCRYLSESAGVPCPTAGGGGLHTGPQERVDDGVMRQV